MGEQARVEIPRYRCHKEVRAARITGLEVMPAGPPRIVLGDIAGAVTEDQAWHDKHQPEVGGYYVVYADGYTSFSPAEAFEDGYAPIVANPLGQASIHRTVTMTVEELACHLGSAIAANMGLKAGETLGFVTANGAALLNAAGIIADQHAARRH